MQNLRNQVAELTEKLEAATAEAQANAERAESQDAKLEAIKNELVQIRSMTAGASFKMDIGNVKPENKFGKGAGEANTQADKLKAWAQGLSN